MTKNGQVTIPPHMRRRHGLTPESEVKLVERPEGILIIGTRKLPVGKRVIASMLRGGHIRRRTSEWLKMTRGR